MFKINIKFNSGSSHVIETNSKQSNVSEIITNIGTHLYPEKYNPKLDQYIKIIQMGKIIELGEQVVIPDDKNEILLYCVVKKIPDEAFVIEEPKTIGNDLVNKLIESEEFKEIIRQKSVYNFFIKNINNIEQVIAQFENLNSGKEPSLPNPVKISNSEKYRDQINILKNMGFIDELELADLLASSNGNIETVINILMC